MDREISSGFPAMSAADVLAGLGGADRNLLATALALFDDSKLYSRAEKLVNTGVDAAQRAWGQPCDESDAEDARHVVATKENWRISPWSDDDLRLLLWIRLRESMDLPPRLTASWRGCDHLANDLIASLINSLDPPSMVKSGKRWLCQQGWLAPGEHATTLAEIVVPILDEMLEKAHKGEEDAPDRDTRRSRLAKTLVALREVSAADRDQLLQETGADQANDRTIRNALLLGGSLGAFGVGVSSAGFSAYILAAQASAFVPLLTGPGLVSLVSVVSNPVFIVAAAGGGAWHFASSARRKVNASVASHVVTLLTVQGLQTGRSGLERARQSFARMPRLVESEVLPRKKRDAWAKEWEVMQSSSADIRSHPPDWVVRSMDVIVDPDVPDPGLSPGSAPPTGDERANAAILGTLTIGDVLYHYYAVDPSTIAAADFSRIADIDGPIAFSRLAEDMLSGSDREVLGGISQLKGYVAEKAVAAELVAAGHAVSFPEVSNEPGIDLLVDGEPFQVKFHATPQGIREHFATYDYPVYANSELKGNIPEEWEDRVYFIDGLGNEVVADVTESSLHAAADMFDTAVLTSAGVIAVGRGALAYRSGRVSGQQALEQILLDGTLRTSLAGGGVFVGSAVGYAVFGPAGAWVFGAGGPVLAAMQTTRVTEIVRKHARGAAHQEWERATHRQVDILLEAVLQALDRKAQLFEDKINATPDTVGGRYLRWRLVDDLRFAHECRNRITDIPSSEHTFPEQRATELLRCIAAAMIHPVAYQRDMRALTQLLSERPGLRELLDREKLSDAVEQRKAHAERWSQAAKDRAQDSGLTDWVSAKAGRFWGRGGPKQ